MAFSSALQLTDLSDFITPSQACVKPQLVDPETLAKERAATQKRARIVIGGDDADGVKSPASAASDLPQATITLNDCLACSGCITSAESVLITAQSQDEFVSALSSAESSGKTFVVSLSPQSRASIAAHFGLSASSTHKRLITFFRSLGVQHVFDTSYSRDMSLMETRTEFVERFRASSGALVTAAAANAAGAATSPLPLITSACPGWICYAEKSYGETVLPFISTAKSPQQVMGSLVKRFYAQRVAKTSPERIYHVAIMPCYDKKLEASREDFFDEVAKTRDVDCVLSSEEVVQLLKSKGVSDLRTIEESALDSLFTHASADGHTLLGVEAPSGGYLEETFRFAAKELFGADVAKLEYENPSGARRPNPDFREISLRLSEGAEPVLRFAYVYGFKNIQRIVPLVLKGSSPYHFVEIMACPGACTNGGGQVRSIGANDSTARKEQLKRVDEIYRGDDVHMSRPDENAAVGALYSSFVGGVPYSPQARKILHTQYHGRAKLVNRLTIQW